MVAVASMDCGRKSSKSDGGAGAGGAGHAGEAGATSTGGTSGDAGSSGAAGSAGAAAGTGDAAAGGATAGTDDAAVGAGDAAAGAGDAAAGARDAAVVVFKNYEVTGTFRTQPIAIEQKPGQLKYTKIVIGKTFLAESCAIGDYNNDGAPDVSSGRLWYEGPDFTTTHAFREGHGALPRNGDGPEVDTGNSDDTADYPFDLNGDGWTDIIDIAANDINEVAKTNPKIGKVQVHDTAVWYENPGKDLAGDPMWHAHLMHDHVGLEQHGLVDMNRDGYPEIFGACGACTPPTTKGYFQGDPKDPTARWTFHSVTIAYLFPFGGLGHLHGEGAGDVNGDGLPDLLERGGAWLQKQPGGVWNQTICTGNDIPAGCGWIKTSFYDGLPDGQGDKGGSHMYAVDMDMDGLTDVVSADWAHGVGLYWYKQGPGFSFTKFKFMGDAQNSNSYTSSTPNDFATWGAGFTVPHALQVVDMDGDGRPDVVTGKMRLAAPLGHGDPDGGGTPFIFVFRNVAETDARTGAPITLKPVQVDPDPMAVVPGTAGTPEGGMGVGRQVTVGHVNTDGILDICVATKVGLAVFLGK